MSRFRTGDFVERQCDGQVFGISIISSRLNRDRQARGEHDPNDYNFTLIDISNFEGHDEDSMKGYKKINFTVEYLYLRYIRLLVSQPGRRQNGMSTNFGQPNVF